MITLDKNGTAIQLSDRLDWVDEFDWSPVEQSITYSTTGAMHVDVGVKQAGRQITLHGTETAAWLARNVCDTLYAWAALPGAQFTLTLRGIDRTVIFDHAKGGFSAKPLWSVLDGEQDGDELLAPTFHFLEV
jgi:hypothetical protein